MSQAAPIPAAEQIEIAVPTGVFSQTVVSVEHFTDRLFRFRIERPASFRFRAGEFVMIGLPNADKPIYRAYSIASASWDDEIEFYSIKVPNGPLTSKLQKIRPGDKIWMRAKPTGTLVTDALLPGKRLFMIATGTGIAPFGSLVREPDVYERFDSVILTNTCRDLADLAYGNALANAIAADPLVGEQAATQLRYYPTTTRETSARMGRMTQLIDDGTFFKDLNLGAFDPETDRVMICGSVEMNLDIKQRIEAAGLHEGSNARPGQFVIERAFVG